MNDISVNSTNLIPKNNINSKPSYLVVLEEMAEVSGKSKMVVKHFITLERPDTEAAYVKMKGFYTESTEEDAINNYQEQLTTVPKEAIIELMVPWGKVHKIRSLVFKAK